MDTASLGGDVLISGGVRGARVSADWLDLHTGEIYRHLGEAVTDATGHFAIPTAQEFGIFRIVARGGTYEDLATGATIDLDDTDEIVSLIHFGPLDVREQAIVSPIGNLVAARTMERLSVLGDLTAAFKETRQIFHAHFGNADWGAFHPWPLDQPAPSPTEPVRAAFVHVALSVLARDLAADTGAGPQEVNVYRLMRRWTEDVRAGTFDGNDGNDPTPGSGLQLGYCPPPDPGCVVPGTGCTLGSCRRLCDLYAGTARTLLAGAIAKVINDGGPGGLNQTGLDLANTLSIVRGVSDNTDPELFDAAACVEALDRQPPLLGFVPPTPAAGAYVRGAIQIKAVATDALDRSPDVGLPGLVDLDGDPRDAVALAAVDTTTRADGPWTVVARAFDLGGNVATAERVLEIDNTAPAVVISPTGFFVDGSTWWTPSATPTLSGTVTDASPVAVKAVIAGGVEVLGAVSGGSWTLSLAGTPLHADGSDVQIIATDAAGNTSSVFQRLKPDVDAPALSFQASTVHDEASESVTFADHSPHHHHHTGMEIELATTAGCPSVTKFSYLLGAATPEYVTESDAPNPLRYQLVVYDPGVGLEAGEVQYRVGRQDGMQVSWLLDWTSAGAGVPALPGAVRFPVSIFSGMVPGLDTIEGTYEVEFRAKDRFGRTEMTRRCFALSLRAPPLEVEAHSDPRQTKDHTYALDLLSLAPGAQFDNIAARLLNNDATGASLIDQDVFNGTTSTIYLTATVTRPDLVTVARSFVLDNALTQIMEITGPCIGSACEAAPNGAGPLYTSTASVFQSSLPFPVKVFELVNGAPATEISCLAPCPLSKDVYRFALPPRAGGGSSARAFRVMTMIGQVSALWPQDVTEPPGSPAPPPPPPFVDDEIVWRVIESDPQTTTTTRLTGFVDRSVVTARSGCLAPQMPPMGPNCKRVGTLVPYRALHSAALTFSSATRTQYATAPTAGPVPAPTPVGTTRQRAAVPANNWSTAEAVLP